MRAKIVLPRRLHRAIPIYGDLRKARLHQPASQFLQAIRGLRVALERIPVRPVTRKLCAALGIDPLRLISSGVMLIAHPDGDALRLALREHGIEATAIGVFTASPEKVLLNNGREDPLVPPEGDEIYRALGIR